MDLASIAGKLARLGAPVLGGALGGPAGAAIATTVIEALASGFNVDATPEAVDKALDRAEAAIVVPRIEAAEAPAVIEAVNEYLRDVQDARATTVKLVEQGSAIAWGAPIVSTVVMLAFAIFSYLAINSPVSGPAREVVMYLLGAWQGLAATVVAYWVGSSVGSKAKDATLADVAASAARTAAGRNKGR